MTTGLIALKRIKKGAEAPFPFAGAKHWPYRLNPQALQPEPQIYTMLAKDTIIIKAPPGTKSRWVRMSQAQNQKLSDWVVQAVEKKQRLPLPKVRLCARH